MEQGGEKSHRRPSIPSLFSTAAVGPGAGQSRESVNRRRVRSCLAGLLSESILMPESDQKSPGILSKSKK